jgi:hypothetical protein
MMLMGSDAILNKRNYGLYSFGPAHVRAFIEKMIELIRLYGSDGGVHSATLAGGSG